MESDKKNSIFQPGHDGKHRQVELRPGTTVSHLSHGLGDHARGHAVPGVLGRDGAPKLVRIVPVSGGMQTRTKTGAIALGGTHKSAIDSLSGQTIVPGAPVQATGYNPTAQSGNPLAKPPGSKTVLPVAPAFGMHNRAGDHDLHAIGQEILREAFAASAADDCAAHGRRRDGGK